MSNAQRGYTEQRTVTDPYNPWETPLHYLPTGAEETACGIDYEAEPALMCTTAFDHVTCPECNEVLNG